MAFPYNAKELKSLERFKELEAAMKQGKKLSISNGTPVNVLQLDLNTQSIDAHDGDFNGVAIPLEHYDYIMQNIIIH